MVRPDRASAHLDDLLRGVVEPVAGDLGAALFYDALRFVRERELEDDLVLTLIGGEVESFFDGWCNKTRSWISGPESSQTSGKITTVFVPDESLSSTVS
jgi:hypothetical protein